MIAFLLSGDDDATLVLDHHFGDVFRPLDVSYMALVEDVMAPNADDLAPAFERLRSLFADRFEQADPGPSWAAVDHYAAQLWEVRPSAILGAGLRVPAIHARLEASIPDGTAPPEFVAAVERLASLNGIVESVNVERRLRTVR